MTEKQNKLIEIDGPIHERQKDYDEIRTHLINMLGIEVMRFKNEERDNNLESVLKEISNYL